MKNLIGQRICILGLSSSGKSTLAKRIADKRACELLHLDLIAHQPYTDWQRRPLYLMEADHNAFIAQQEWVIDGNYSEFMPSRFERADTIIYLTMNRFGCLFRYIMRTFKPQRIGQLAGAKNCISLEMIRYILFEQPYNRKKYENIIQQYPHLNVIYIHSFKEMDQLLTLLDSDISNENS